MKKFIKNNYKLSIILVAISLLFSFFVARSLFSDFQFAILSDNESGIDYISIGTKDDVNIPVEENDGEYNLSISESFTGYSIDLSYEKNDGEIKSVLVNGAEIETYKVNTYAYDRYDNLTFFNVDRKSNTFIKAFVIIFLVLFAILLFVFNSGKYKSLVPTITKTLGFKHIIISSTIVLLTLFLVCGCDAKVIVNVARFFIDGVDIYQFQINSRNLLGTVYAEFPYNQLSMIVYGGFFGLTSFVTKNLPLIGNYPYFQVFTIKIINLFLVQMTILHVLSYLYDKKKIKKGKLLLIYYLSIFNPVTFYVAFLFVQLDPLSLFLITLGLLNLEKVKDNNYFGVLFIALGLVIKTQLLLLFPIIMLSLIVYSFQNEKFFIGLKKVCISFVIILCIVVIFLLSNNLIHSSFYLLNSSLEQAERLYYTTINYMGFISVYVSIFFVGLAIFGYAFSLKISTNFQSLTKTNLLYMLILIFILSATIVPTPSIYVLSLPAFIVLLYDEDDIFRILMIYAFSIGIIVLPILSDYGDVTILLTGFNKESLLMKFMNNLEYVDYVKINNIIFTVSVASMVAYISYCIKKSKKYLEGNNE